MRMRVSVWIASSWSKGGLEPVVRKGIAGLRIGRLALVVEYLRARRMRPRCIVSLDPLASLTFAWSLLRSQRLVKSISPRISRTTHYSHLCRCLALVVSIQLELLLPLTPQDTNHWDAAANSGQRK